MTNKSTEWWAIVCPLPLRSAKTVEEIPESKCREFQNLEVREYVRFQVDSWYGHEIIVAKVIFSPFCTVTPKFKMAIPKSIAIWPYPTQVSVPRIKLTVLKRSYALETKLDLCDLNDLENQGHHLKINRHPEGSIVKVHTKFQIDRCKPF